MLQEFIKPSIHKAPIYIKADTVATEERIANWHFHEDIEMIWVQKGELYLFINHHSYTLSEGDIVFINNLTPHKTRTPKGCTKFLLQFKHALILTEQLDKLILNPLIQKNKPFFIFRKDSPANNQLLLCFEQLINELASQQTSYLAYIKASYFISF